MNIHVASCTIFKFLMYRKNDFEVKSYGTGKEVRLPGPAPNRPNVYSFGTPYDQMYKELVEKDPKLYETNGVLVMLERNRQLKTAPERWHQETEEMFDVVITCEERCFDSVCEGMGVFFLFNIRVDCGFIGRFVGQRTEKEQNCSCN
jgi:RNA polymerase II subunit A C-terminal domain phosphatase SSU72